MQPRQDLPRAAHRLITQQGGVITTAQLLDTGISRRVIERLSRVWARPAKGIHLTAHPTWESALWAGLLRGGPSAVIGGLAACYLEGALRDEPTTVLVWSPERRVPFNVGGWQIRFRRGSRDGYRSPARTRIHPSLLDVAASHDELDTMATITGAFARQVAEPGRLLSEMDLRPRQRHREVIEALCEPASKGVHSLIEWVFLRDVIRAHGLPEPDLQVSKAAGRVDEHFQQFATIVELDGMRDHSEWSKDMYRDNEHLLDEGNLTLRYGLNDALTRPCEVSAQVTRRFRSRGWTGKPRRCRRCKAA